MRLSARLVAVPAILATITILGSAITAKASVVTSVPDGTVYQQNTLNYFGEGPQTVAPGITWTANSFSAVYGYANVYNFDSNGFWEGNPMAGVDGDNTMTFTFATPVSAVGGLLNYTPGMTGSPFTIAVYDTEGNLIESSQPVFSTGGGENSGEFLGFEESGADIGSFVISGQSGGLRDLTVDASSTAVTPEPSSLVLLGTGVAGMFARRFRRA